MAFCGSKMLPMYVIPQMWRYVTMLTLACHAMEMYQRMTNPSLNFSCTSTQEAVAKAQKSMCRFGAPWPPMRQTKILDALTADTCSDFKSLPQDYQKMMKVMRKMPTDVETFDEWLKYLNTSEEHYLHVLQSSITRHKMCPPMSTSRHTCKCLHERSTWCLESKS